MDLRLKALLSGLSTHIPWIDRKGFTGGTNSARYCYSVWLRHLVLGARVAKMSVPPPVVAELGPGDSIGIGLAALLCGVEKYFSLDLVRYSDVAGNLAVFDELVPMFLRRSSIPDDAEFPFLYPKLTSYEFPHFLFDEGHLRNALTTSRLAAIRSSIQQTDAVESMIAYKAPWNAPYVIDAASVDYVFSQAVLEHVDGLEDTYGAMKRWLKPGGVMTHQIDFKCHGKANVWNGHWGYSDWIWKIIVGRRSYLLNRQPHSVHTSLITKSGFNILQDTVERTATGLRRDQLSARFRNLSEDDLHISGTFIVASAASGV